MTVLLRSIEQPLEIMGDGRTLEALIVPYNTPTTVDDGYGPFQEAIDPNAFTRVLRGSPSYVRLHLEHGGPWVGRGHRWMNASDGLHMAFRVDDTAEGQTALYKIKDGQVPGMSIGYVPGRSETRMSEKGPVEWRLSVKTLHHTALVPTPAYIDAKVSALRSAPATSADRLDQWKTWLHTVQ